MEEAKQILAAENQKIKTIRLNSCNSMLCSLRVGVKKRNDLELISPRRQDASGLSEKNNNHGGLLASKLGETQSF